MLTKKKHMPHANDKYENATKNIFYDKHEKDNYLSAVAKNMISCFVLKDAEAETASPFLFCHPTN